MYRDHGMKTLTERIKLASSLLKSGCDLHMLSSHEIKVPYLEAIAGVRFALMVVAELLNCCVTESSEQLFSAQTNDLLRLAEDICTKVQLTESDTAGPMIYLIKLLVRQYGSNKLIEVSKIHAWVLPPQLMSEQTVSSIIFNSKLVLV